MNDWKAEVVSRLFANRISRGELADELGMARTSLSSLLHSTAPSRKSTEKKVNDAIDRIIARKSV